MDFTLSAIKPFVLGEDPETKRELQGIDTFLRKELANAKVDSERRLEILFYAITTKLRLFSIETPEMERLFHMFLSEMDIQILRMTYQSLREEDSFGEMRRKGIKKYFSQYFNAIDRRLRILENKVHLNQMKAFLYVCEHYVHTLEKYYKEMSMSDRVLELYVTRMNIKKNRFFLKREFGLYIGFSVFRTISNYGTSFGRLAITCTFSILVFGSVYWLADYFAPESVRMIPNLTDYSSYLFNSLVTISGLGIDASPQTALQRVAMGVNTIYGMIVFGMLFNVISTKLSMNN